jgi:ureidoglycolate lyase
MTGKAGMTASARPAAASAIVLRPQALTAASFAAFGDVIETEGRESRWINDGTCRRFDDLAHVDVSEQEGHAALSIFEADVRPMPLHIRTLERHPLASQAFIPLQTQPFLVVVAEDAAGPVAARLRVFLSSGRQGVNYRRNVWHHSLIALSQAARFLVVDRSGTGENCEECSVDEGVLVEL